jgi:hypothetical protein
VKYLHMLIGHSTSATKKLTKLAWRLAIDWWVLFLSRWGFL